MCDNESTAVVELPSSAMRIKQTTSLLPSDNGASVASFPFGTGGGSPSLPTGGQVSPATLAEYQQRLQIYDYAAQAALRFRLSQHAAMSGGASQYALGGHPALSEIGSSFATMSPFSRFDPRFRFMHEEPKPQHSYIGLIAMAILSSPEKKMVLSDIYQHILDNYPYFRNRGPGWRNSIRHNLSLNDCFVKAGRSANGKGHYWAIHPANIEDFKKGDFRRRKAQRKVRKHMGLSVPDDEDSQSPTPTPTPRSGPTPFDHHPTMGNHPLHLMSHGPPLCNNLASLQEMCLPLAQLNNQIKSDRLLPMGYHHHHHHNQPRDFSGSFSNNGHKTAATNSKPRLFDVESLLAPDSSSSMLIETAKGEKSDGSKQQSPGDASPISSSHSPKELPDSNCSSPSASSDITTTSPPPTCVPGDKRMNAADQQQNGAFPHHPHQLTGGGQIGGLAPWQAAHIQSLQNLHQINASLVNQSLRPSFPMWTTAAGFGALPPASLLGGYAMMAGSHNSGSSLTNTSNNGKPIANQK